MCISLFREGKKIVREKMYSNAIISGKTVTRYVYSDHYSSPDMICIHLVDIEYKNYVKSYCKKDDIT